MDRYTSGRLVSPQALSTPLPKLYTAIAGIPREYIRRYVTALGSSSDFVFRRFSIGSARRRQIRHASTPMILHTSREECTVSLTPLSSPAPRR